MLDWKPGDRLVADRTSSEFLFGENNLPDLVVGRTYTLAEIEDTLHPCPDPDCTSQLVCGIEEVPESIYGDGGYCSCCFRKPIDFKKLCNVQERTKEPDYV